MLARRLATELLLRRRIPSSSSSIPCPSLTFADPRLAERVVSKFCLLDDAKDTLTVCALLLPGEAPMAAGAVGGGSVTLTLLRSAASDSTSPDTPRCPCRAFIDLDRNVEGRVDEDEAPKLPTAALLRGAVGCDSMLCRGSTGSGSAVDDARRNGFGSRDMLRRDS